MSFKQTRAEFPVLRAGPRGDGQGGNLPFFEAAGYKSLKSNAFKKLKGLGRLLC